MKPQQTNVIIAVLFNEMHKCLEWSL